MKRALIFFSIFFALGFVVLFVGELREVLATDVSSWKQDQRADCAVVLTGGANRLREGLDLLARKNVQKLMIMGVHPSAELRDIFPLLPFYGNVNSEDIVLEKYSQTTFGNAQQTAGLVEVLHCRDLILVTSRLHMSRAYRTFRADLSSVISIYPRATPLTSSEAGWWEVAIETFKSMFYRLWAY